MSMTREQAIDYLRNEIENAHKFSNDHQTYHESLLALTILAPEPRTEPPVELDGNVWYSDVGDLWVLTAVDYVRKHWRDGEQWLPLSALPVPEGGA